MEKQLQIEDATLNRVRNSAIKTQEQIIKLTKATDEYWKKDRNEKAKTAALDELADKYRFINESIFSNDSANRAAEEAAINEGEKHIAQMEEKALLLQQQEDGYKDFAIELLTTGAIQTEEGQKALADYEKRIEKRY